jgi:hypothetical protein
MSKRPKKSTSTQKIGWRFAHTDIFQDDKATSAHFIKSPSAIIREFGQNALDEAAISNKPVTIKISLMDVAADVVRQYFDETFIDHVDNIISDEREDIKVAAQKCFKSNGKVRVLVLEDFGTSGLIGQYDSLDPKEGKNFFGFMRARGSSNTKGKNKGGSWGLGKATFWLASKVRTILVYSVRSTDDRTSEGLLMGRCVLPMAKVKNSKNILEVEDGQWGLLGGELVLPITSDDEDSTKISDFVGNFKAKRLPQEPGLTVVIPYLTLSFDNFCDDMVKVFAEEWALPLLSRTMSVEIYDHTTNPQKSSTLDDSAIQGYSGKFSDPSLARILDLTSHVRNKTITELPYKDDCSLDAGVFTKDHDAEIRSVLAADKKQKVFKITNIPTKPTPSEEARGHLYVMVTVNENNEPQYIQLYRGSLRIGRAKGMPAQPPSWPGGYKPRTGIDLWADDGAVAALIRAGEQPSHCGVDPSSSEKFKKDGMDEDAWRFIVNLPHAIHSILTQASSDKDLSFFADAFPAEGGGKASNLLRIVTSRLRPGIKNKIYKARIRAEGGDSPYAWSVSSPGDVASIEQASGILTIKSQNAKDPVVVAVKVEDASGSTASATFDVKFEKPKREVPSADSFTVVQNPNDTILSVKGMPSSWKKGCRFTFGYRQEDKSAAESLGGPGSFDALPKNVNISTTTTGSTTVFHNINGEHLDITWSSPLVSTDEITVTIASGFDKLRELVVGLEGISV